MQVPRVRLLRALRVVARILELVVLPVERGGLLRQQANQHFAVFFESVTALSRGAEFDAVGTGLLLVPARADAQFEPAVGDDVQGRGHVGEHRGMPVVDAGDQRAQPQPFGGLRQCGQGRPALKAGSGRVGEDRIEVVESPARLVYVDIIGCLPDGEHVGPSGVLRGCFEGKSHVFQN